MLCTHFAMRPTHSSGVGATLIASHIALAAAPVIVRSMGSAGAFGSSESIGGAMKYSPVNGFTSSFRSSCARAGMLAAHIAATVKKNRISILPFVPRRLISLALQKLAPLHHVFVVLVQGLGEGMAAGALRNEEELLRLRGLQHAL